ncbi:tryptophan synthase subunit beta like protein [Halomonas alimentaria]|uniref:Tryptophan synthase subunit beta like protein n=1 Tax=Halomonas alimentaria TaxID=147248 RepID=A0A7X5AP83_9GAMM|nr:tryptophan synthase subunit beta like protein [Halomonas alimentaria]NAW32841.1 tryptophan synthase subunit beta like protein [Halomonas alimentaria]
MYVKRNETGQIVQAAREPTAECREFVPPCAPDLQAFMAEDEEFEGVDLSKTDLAFVRVLEDVIELLMDKGVISFTELPEAAQEKVMERQSLRRRLNGLQLVDSEDEEGGVI